MEEFYEKVQHVLDEIPRGDVLYVIGDWNAKVGQDETNGTTGSFGLGERNERGDQLVEFCSRNDGLQIILQVTCTEAVHIMEISGPNHQKSDRLPHMQNEMEK